MSQVNSDGGRYQHLPHDLQLQQCGQRSTTNGGPYAVRSLNGGTAFGYDAKGNITSSPSTPFGDPARTLSWNVENLPGRITSGTVTENYTYDADGERATRAVTQNGVTTTSYYFGGLYEEEKPSGTTRSHYTLNGQVVAQRESVPVPPTPTNTPTKTPAPLPTKTPTPLGGGGGVDPPCCDPGPTGAELSSISSDPNAALSMRAEGGAEGGADRESGESRWSEMRQVREVREVISAPTSPLYVATQSVAPEVTSTSETMAAITTATTATSDVSPTPTPTTSSSSSSSTSSKASYRIDATTDTVVYIHSDHLGSVSTVTNQGGGVVSTQQFDPWGKVRTGGISVVDLNYTGQRKDDTGLLYYHARYYDPSLARFVSPDSIVPGDASAKGGAAATIGLSESSNLTVDYHESGLSIGTSTLGPRNPASLNRYAYVFNNPLRYIDPTGHGVDEPRPKGDPTPDEEKKDWKKTSRGALIPPVPEGQGTQNEWGNRVWGKTPGDAEQTSRDIDNMSDEEFLDWCRRNGIDERTATDWRDFYDAERKANPTNPSAGPRAELLEKIRSRQERIRHAQDRNRRSSGGYGGSPDPAMIPWAIAGAAAAAVGIGVTSRSCATYGNCYR